jgi:hypothetical protein
MLSDYDLHVARRLLLFWIDHYHSHSFFFLHLLRHVVTQEQLDHAKEATKSAILMNLDQGYNVLAPDQILIV